MKSVLKSELRRIRDPSSAGSRGRMLHHFESLSYDLDLDILCNATKKIDEPLPNLSSTLSTTDDENQITSTAAISSHTCNRWNLIVKTGLIFILGIICAIFGVGIHSLIFLLLNIRNKRTTYLMYQGDWNDAFLNHISLALLFGLFAFIFVTFDLAAVGSGKNRLMHSI